MNIALRTAVWRHSGSDYEYTTSFYFTAYIVLFTVDFPYLFDIFNKLCGYVAATICPRPC